MKNIVVVMVVVAGLTACSSPPQEEGYSADNSDQSVRDRSDAAVTAKYQSSARSDLTVTQAIRAAVGADKTLANNPDSFKIISANGVVTLRGPVGNADEKASIGATAEGEAGVTRVNNELEIGSGHVPCAPATSD